VGVAGFSAEGSQYVSLAINANNEPYVAYIGLDAKKVTVSKFDGTNWQTVGEPDFSGWDAYDASLAFGNGPEPYVAYTAYGGVADWDAWVEKFDGTDWVNVGTMPASTRGAEYASLKFSSDGVPYLAYADGDNFDKATVKKFDGASWLTVGTAGFSEGDADYLSLALNPNGVPYVAYSDDENAKKLTVMKFTAVESIESNSAPSAALKLYPNPANTKVSIENIPANATIRIVDLTGKQLYYSNTFGRSSVIETGQFDDGLYILQVEGRTFKMSIKLVINHQSPGY